MIFDETVSQSFYWGSVEKMKNSFIFFGACFDQNDRKNYREETMRFIFKMIVPLLFFVSNTFAAEATVEVGTAIEKYEVAGKEASYTLEPNSRLYAGVKVTFWRDGKQSSAVELKIPRSPYRTHAYWILKAGESGLWTVKVQDSNGNLLTSKDVPVKVTGN